MYIKILLLGAIGLVNASGWFNEFFWWLGKREVCYQGYGCFSTAHPFSNSEGQLPQSPQFLNVRVLHYTRQNRNVPVDITQRVGANFNSSKDIKIIIHGYFNNMRNRWLTDMKDAFLQKDDVHVFILDWEIGAGALSYHQSVANSRIVAAIAAKHLQDLQVNHNVNPSSVHIVGFSLGAHLAGYIGSQIRGLGRITGLDPAGPNFERTDPAVRLDPSDALFVDVIHTDGDQLFNINLSPGFGTEQAMGHVDFYVNGGSDQPGCANHVRQHLLQILRGLDPIQNFGCSHLRALDLFIESINSDCMFSSYPCEMNKLKGNICNTCGETGCTYMGYHSTKSSGTGIYLTKTRRASPYCIA